MSAWWNRRRFDLFELGCVVVLVGLAYWGLGRATLLRSVMVLDLEAEPLVASETRDLTERWGKDAKEVSAGTIMLNDLLAHLQGSRIDLSIDVELSEPKVLAGLDIERAKPAFVCIEAHPEVRQQILDYFATHRYVIVGKYLRADTRNLYFVPLN
jgi:hypothetical protein